MDSKLGVCPETRCTRPGRARVEALDSLRGLAAISVVLYHVVFAMPHVPWRLFYRTPLAFVLMGPEAVLLFFVLSGFVLTLQLGERRLAYGVYLQKRIFRIYLPYLGALVVAMIGSAVALQRHPTWEPPYMKEHWATPITFSTWAAVLSFVFFSKQVIALNPVIWSLVYEMRISLLLPLLLGAFRRCGTPAILLLSFGLSALTAWIVLPYDPQFLRSFTDTPWILTLHYLVLFACGCALALHRDTVIAALSTGRRRYVLLGASLLLYYAADPLTHLAHIPTNALTHDWIVTIGVCGIIACCLGEHRLSRALRLPLFSYLGKISYSIYLTHFIVMILLIRFLGPVLSYPMFAVLTLLLVIPVAHLAYYGFEWPALQFARRVRTHRLSAEGGV